MSKKDRSEARREEILEAAFDSLMENGLRMLSYDDIAEDHDLSRQLIIYHFPDPESLMIALCDKIALVYRENLVRLVRDAKGCDRLQIFFDYYFDVLEGSVKKPRDDQVYDAMLSLSARSNAVQKNLHSQYLVIQQVVGHELQFNYPQLRTEECEQLGYLFVCLMYGHWKMVASLGFSEEHKHVTRAAIDRLIQSYIQD